MLHRISAIVARNRICHKAAVSLIPASMIPALPDRAEAFRVLETLVIGTAGGLLFSMVRLPLTRQRVRGNGVPAPAEQSNEGTAARAAFRNLKAVARLP